ncbi:unnamed protein product [Brassicogethes aeneus]|uniref:Elongation of very long chain fatty acids protein n=1 Tax=Brassicogethes aeneus TaxID=1431903 RepID=A0A9P0BDH3_BRAAE|nr:unnamed protein product [Brassicogethes aeneus]
MALIAKTFQIINSYFNENQDPRVADWILLSSPVYTVTICLVYLLFVKVLGPAFMKNRNPFELKHTLTVYNAFLVLFNSWLFYEIGMSGWLTGEYSFICEPMDYLYKPKNLRMVNVLWYFLVSKFIELLDTVFFVARKKYNQITTLHIIHHTSVPMSVWLGIKYTPMGHGTFFPLINSFIHIIMYGYYMLSAFGPSIQKYLWWKKYITVLQMAQFVALGIHTGQLAFIECDYPRGIMTVVGLQAIMFYFLFRDFYKKAYKKKHTHKMEKLNNNSVEKNE